MAKKQISIISYPVGGPRTWAENLGKELQKRDFEVEFFFGRPDYLRAIRKKHELIHTTVPLPFLRAKKTILTIHGNFREEKMTGKVFFPRAIKSANSVTIPSEYLKKILEVESALVIPNAIETHAEPRSEFNFVSGSPTLGLLTNFDFPGKARGALVLSRLAAKNFPEAQVLVAGSGKHFKEFKKLITRANPRANCLGHVDREKFFSQIDIFTYSSFFDNQPNALLEAMAAGIPTASISVGAIPEVLSGESSRYLAYSEPEFTQIIRNLIESPLARKENAQTMRNRALDFSWEKIIWKFLEIY